MPLRLLTKDDLTDLLYKIEDVTGDWMKLGLSLKLPVAMLKEIEIQCGKHDVGRCKMEMLTLWLNMDVYATWESLASALERGLKMYRLAKDIRQLKWVEYAEPANNGGLRMRDRSGGSTIELVSSSEAGEEQIVKPTKLLKGNSAEHCVDKHCVDYYCGLEPHAPSLNKFTVRVNGHKSVASSPAQAASTGSLPTHLAATDQPSFFADSDFSLMHPDASPSLAGPSKCTSGGSPTRSSLISDSHSTTNPIPIPSATSILPTPSSSSSAPVRPTTISIGQSTENLQTASSRRSSTPAGRLPASASEEQKKRKQSLKNDVSAAENKRIECLKRHFAYLVNAVLDILQDEEHTDVYQVQVLVQQLPISCSDPQRVLEPQERLDIQKAKSISQIFSILSVKYISYENFGLLESIAQTFCNRRAQPLLDAYTKEYHDPDSTGHSPLQQIFTEEGLKLAKMKESFANLVVKIIRIFEKEGLNLLQLSVYICSSSVKKLCLQDRENLKHPESVSHIFSIIISYIEYNNYNLLQCIVKRFGNDKAKRLMRKYKQKLGDEQHDTTHSSDENDDSSTRSDGRSSTLTNHTLTSYSSRSRAEFSSDVDKDSTHDCSEDQEQQQHCLQEAASNYDTQDTTSAVDTLSAATVSTHQTNTDDTHSAETVSTGSHPLTDDTHSAATVSTSTHQSFTHSTTSASTSSHPLPLTDKSMSGSLALSQRVCCSEKLSTSSYLLAVTSGAASSTATSSSLSTCTSATKTSPHIQTVVVKTFFVPWDKGQIHVQPQQKVKVDTRNLARTKSGKNVPFVKVLTESGRKGKVPVSVLDIESLPAACTSSQLTDNQSLQQSHRDRTSISSSNGYCDVSNSEQTTKKHPPHTIKLSKKNSQSLTDNKLVASAAADVTMARRVTWSPNISSTALSPPSVPQNSLSRPQSLPISVSPSKRSIQESPQSAIVKLPNKRSKALRFLSHVKGFFIRRNEFETVYTAVDELRIDRSSDACSDCTLSPKMEWELNLERRYNSRTSAV